MLSSLQFVRCCQYRPVGESRLGFRLLILLGAIFVNEAVSGQADAAAFDFYPPGQGNWALRGVKSKQQTAKNAAQPNDLLFQCEFESPDWFKEWDARKPDPHTEIVTEDPDRRFVPLQGKALRIRVDQGGHYGASLQFDFKKRTGSEPEEIYFRYYLRLANDWKPERGGKLPGLGGTYGRAGWGGRPVNGSDGWSARGLFLGQKDGRTPIGYYCYHVDMKGQYGSNWVWDKEQRGFLENNRWYCIEQFARLNTPGKNDGILGGWVDGELAFKKTDVRMRDVDSLKIETVWLNLYYGGTWTAKADYHLYIDNVAISRRPIGLLAPTAAR